MQEGEHVIGSIPRVNRPLLKEVASAVRSLLKVLLLSRIDVVKVDRDEVVPVRPRVLVHKAESVEQLVDWGCQARVETNAEKDLSLFPCGDIILPVQVEFLLPPNPSKSAATRVTSVRDGDKTWARLNLRQELDAGHLAGDVVHRLQDYFLQVVWEGVVEPILDHSLWPPQIKMSESATNFRPMMGNNVAFQD